MSSQQPGTGTQSIDRAADLVTRVVRGDDGLTAAELAEATGLARSTTSRLLAALERAELLARDGSGRWAPGALFQTYSTRRTDDELLAELSGPTMRELGDVTGETVNLGVPRFGTVVQVAQVESAYYLGSRDWVGTDVPAHASALGKVLYAHGAIPAPTGRLEAPSPGAITTGAELSAQLPGIRRDGFATTVDELEPGLTGVAAPVRRRGTVVAALGISGPTSRLSAELASTGALVASHAAALSARLEDHPHEGAA